MPKLVVLTVGFNERSLDVKPEKTTIGRLEDNQFCLAEPSVSSHHCEVWAKGDEIVVKDLGSTNGSFVNEKQLEPGKEVTVRPGQTLRLGQVELRYETGKKQTEQARATVKIGDAGGQTIVMSKNSAFAKKSNNLNKIFLAVGALLVVVIVVLLVKALTSVSGPGQ